MNTARCLYVLQYLFAILFALMVAGNHAQTIINATAAAPICNLKCPVNYTCFDNSSQTITKIWGYNGHVCSTDLECFGEADPRGTIRGPKQLPVTMQEGDTLILVANQNRFSFQPYNVTRKTFDSCGPFTEEQKVIPSEKSNFIVPQNFLTVGVHYFIAKSSNFIYFCRMGLRGEIFVQSRQPCLNPLALRMGVCSGKGLCASNGRFFTRNYSCLCCTGYKGQYCEELDSCSPTVNPCQNGANCTEMIAGHEMKFNCTCAPGFSGKLCETDIDDCKPNPCKNGGFCTDKTNGYECLCSPGSSGVNCEVAGANLCEPNPCLNGGNCSRSGINRNNYTCKCATGFAGRNCTYNITSIPIFSSIASSTLPSLQGSKTGSFAHLSTPDQVSSMSFFDSSTKSTSESSRISIVISTSVLLQNESSGTQRKVTVTTSAAGFEKTRVISSSSVSEFHSFSIPTVISMNKSSWSIMTTFATDRTSSASKFGTSTSSVLFQEANATSILQQDASVTISVLQNASSSFPQSVIPTVSASDDTAVLSTRYAVSTQFVKATPSQIQNSTIQETAFVRSTSTLFWSPTATLEQLPSLSSSESLVVQPSFASLTAIPSSVVDSTTTSDYSLATTSYSHSKPELTSVSKASSVVVLQTSSMIPTSNPLPPTTLPFYNLTCADSPCANNGTCTTVNALLNFKCECPDGTWGPLCSKEFDLHFPRFSNNSYLIINKPIAFTANGNKIVLTFSTLESDGLLFYSVHSKHTDFIQLRVVGGKLEFRFDPGDSLITLKSQASVNTGKRVTAIVSYNTQTRTGSLKVDNNTAITGTARGKLYGVNLNGLLYIGGVPSGLKIRTGIRAAQSPGFQGCIRDIEINEVPIKANDSVSWFNIDECDTPACGRHPCMNGGVCEEDLSNPHEYSCKCPTGFHGTDCEAHSACDGDPCNGGFCVQDKNNVSYPLCLCPYEKAGRLCEESITISVPYFTTIGHYASYMQYRRPEIGVRSFDVMFQFRAEDTMNGIIVYVGQNSYLGGGDDFLAVGINKNKVVLQYNLGSGAATIESEQNISSGWHVVTAGRQGRNGYLYLDGIVSKGISLGELAGLNVFTPLYIGGVPAFNRLPNVIKFQRGFQGSVYNVAIRLDGTTYPLSTSSGSGQWNVIAGRNVKNESFDDCVKQPCKNNGTCVAMGATFVCNCTDGWEGLYCTGRAVPCIGYNPCSPDSTCRPHGEGLKCDCPLGKTGEFCNQGIALTHPLQFKDYSFIAFKPIPIKESTEITIRFKPTTNNGILFYVAWSLQSHSGDFLSITLHDGFVQFRYDLGSGVGRLKSNSRVILNQWHVVSANRSARAGRLQLDSENVLTMSSPISAVGLDVQSNFYLGGVPQLSSITPRAVENSYVLKDFTGCIDRLQVNKQSFSLTTLGAAKGRNIGNCAAADVFTFR